MLYNWLLDSDNIRMSGYFLQLSSYFSAWFYMYQNLESLQWCNRLICNVPQEKKVELKTRVIGSVHAIILALFSCGYLSNMLSFETWVLCLPISGAYGLFDLTIVTLNYKNFKKGYFAICCHHFILIFGPLSTTLVFSRLVSQAYLFEVTVPVLDLSWYLYQTNMKNSLFFKINSCFAIILFLYFRVLNSTYLTYSLFGINNTLFIASSCFWSLNMFWFQKLVNVFWKSIKQE